ncbi:cytochrome P450 85A1-like isoform X2 [Phoenix dactylifera]|uniref:Cytochrome P450 85A1-like isoform X2 n=1 Tax=Phoenix dactylifera TaxID=42345 RepID=A0A8B8J394_PHODC|nr:cytochrome P450 85A1-like isoform X2 [Phoenix dactylifera]
MVVLEVVLGLAFGLLIIFSGLLRWNEVRYRKKGLPPGTMGWPVFGETTEFLKQGPNFMKNQRARYGNLFKTHILGSPTVVCMDPELNRYILMNEGKGLVPGYPQSMQDLMGKWNISAVHGSLHKSMRSAMLSLIGPSLIKDQLISEIDEFLRSYLSNWSGKVIDIQEKTKELWCLSALKLIAGIEIGPLANELKSEIMNLVLGTLSLPIKFPGTNYRRGIQARRKIVSILEKLIEERIASPSFLNYMLDSLLRNDDDAKGKLSDDQIIDLIITLVYSGFETVSTTSMMAVKYLSEHPRALEELRNEQFDIRKGKSPEDTLQWNDYKSMIFTRAVIFETLRLATVVNGVLRRTTQEMEMKGYIIPKGWRIYVYTREVNYDPFMYPEPLAFNPWRWLDKNLESHQYFLAFGGGGRLCPGKELGWEEVGGDRLLKFPRVEAPNGLHIRIWDY